MHIEVSHAIFANPKVLYLLLLVSWKSIRLLFVERNSFVQLANVNMEDSNTYK